MKKPFIPPPGVISVVCAALWGLLTQGSGWLKHHLAQTAFPDCGTAAQPCPGSRSTLDVSEASHFFLSLSSQIFKKLYVFNTSLSFHSIPSPVPYTLEGVSGVVEGKILLGFLRAQCAVWTGAPVPCTWEHSAPSWGQEILSKCGCRNAFPINEPEVNPGPDGCGVCTVAVRGPQRCPEQPPWARTVGSAQVSVSRELPGKVF